MIAPGPCPPDDSFELPVSKEKILYGEWFAHPEPRGAALIMHGYAEHCGRYRELAHVLRKTGLACVSFDFRGHGRSYGQRGFIKSFDDYQEDAQLGLEQLRARVGNDIPVIVVAHSNGALVTMRMLCAKTPELSPSLAILSSPFLGFKVQVPMAKRALAQVAGRLMPTLTLPNEIIPEQLTSDPDKQLERKRDTLCHDVASAKWYIEAQKEQRFVYNRAPDVKAPTHWMVAADDELADVEASRAVRQRLTAPNTYKEYEGFRHEIFNETKRGEVFSDLAEVVDAHLNSI